VLVDVVDVFRGVYVFMRWEYSGTNLHIGLLSRRGRGSGSGRGKVVEGKSDAMREGEDDGRGPRM
jgi:hypothetical protein